MMKSLTEELLTMIMKTIAPIQEFEANHIKSFEISNDLIIHSFPT